MYRVINKNIYLNRGDAITIVLVNNSDTFKANDYIKFRVCEQGDLLNVVLTKTVNIDAQHAGSEVKIELTSEDTRIGEPFKNGSRIYWYEIELNGEITLVGYDNDGPKLFTIWPEAVEGGN